MMSSGPGSSSETITCPLKRDPNVKLGSKEKKDE
jgi:hypothetical protein